MVLEGFWISADLQSVLESWRNWIKLGCSKRIDELSSKNENKQAKNKVPLFHVLFYGLPPDEWPGFMVGLPVSNNLILKTPHIL